MQLRDLKQPSQRRSKQKSASATQSTPQLQCLARQQGNAVQLATACNPDPGRPSTTTAEGSRLQKPFCKPKKGPTQHNRFTAEMDLAAAGLLGQPPPVPVAPKAASDRLQTGLSWPLRPKRSLERQQQYLTKQVPPQPMCVQEKADSKQCQVEHAGGQAVRRDSIGQHQRDVSSSQELSPGAKEALILAGLLSDDQVGSLPYTADCV